MYILLTPDFKPKTGGIAEYLHQLWQQLAQHGDALVFTSVPQTTGPSDSAYELRSLPDIPALAPDASPGQAALHFLQLRRYAQALVAQLQPYLDQQPEIFIGVWRPLTHFWCQALAQQQIPYSLFTYGLELLYPPSDQALQWRQADFAQARRLYACSHQTAELGQQRLGLERPISTIMPGAEIRSDLGDIQARAATLSQQLGQRRLVLSVGRLVARKGHELVIQSLPALRQRFPELHYVIAGDGEHRPALEALVQQLGLEETVTFLGQVDDLTKEALYSLCEVFAMPNRPLGGTDWEGFGIVFLEAALWARPSIGGGHGGTLDAIDDGVTGLLVETKNDYRPTQTALAILLSRPSLGQRLGLAAQARARQTFTWQNAGQQLAASLATHSLSTAPSHP